MSMMDILNKYEKSTFVKMAKLSVSLSLKKHIQNKADVLKNISEQLWNGKDPQIDNDLIKTIQNKLSTNSNDYNFKECRFMALYPEEIVGCNLDYYSKIRTILEKNWQDSFLRRLFISVINHWDKVTSKSNEARHLHKLFKNLIIMKETTIESFFGRTTSNFLQMKKEHREQANI